MKFNKHWDIKGQHAFLSPSQYYWINDDEERLEKRWHSMMAKQRGVELHELAEICIKHGVRLAKNKNALNQFVNDAIGFKMEPEQVLYYSPNCFGTADAISFRKDRGSGKKLLRIHDLKTGEIPAHIEQLEVYAALFCLEYGYSPEDIDIELRIYQFAEPYILIPEPEDIAAIMGTIERDDKLLQLWMSE